jgi:malonate-semialdehyde dehydrogenase (acetylating)/methylmalonate-semialdehyde dehydrogenase
MTSIVPMWINGRPVEAEGARQGNVHAPATGEVIRTVAFARAGEIDCAVRSAETAFLSWKETTALNRSRILGRFCDLLRKNQEPLARLISEEHGKSVSDAMGSMQRGIEVVEFAVGAPHLLKGAFSENVARDIDSHSVLHPLGVCAGITPFNFPAMVPLWMFPMALACGNTFVLKPSEKVPSASMRMAELLKEAGLPDGVLNVVHGDSETVDALIAHPGVRAISFVGSTPVARHIYAAAAQHGKRVQALGGAKNHAVIAPDADMEAAADALMSAAFGSAGQRCMAISAVVGIGAAGDSIVEAMTRKASRLTPADTGPLITSVQCERIRTLIDEGITQGAKLTLDGREWGAAGNSKGFYFGPTIFDRVTTEMSVYQKEIFGPVLVVLRTNSVEEAIGLVNRNPYGNGVAIFTQSGGVARRFENEIEAGMVGVNVAIPIPMAFFSFGGWKASLFGDLCMHGMEGVYFYTRRKTITSRWA